MRKGATAKHARRVRVLDRLLQERKDVYQRVVRLSGELAPFYAEVRQCMKELLLPKKAFKEVAEKYANEMQRWQMLEMNYMEQKAQELRYRHRGLSLKFNMQAHYVEVVGP